MAGLLFVHPGRKIFTRYTRKVLLMIDEDHLACIQEEAKEMVDKLL